MVARNLYIDQARRWTAESLSLLEIPRLPAGESRLETLVDCSRLVEHPACHQRVFELVVAGATQREIGERLGLTRHNVRRQLSDIRRLTLALCA